MALSDDLRERVVGAVVEGGMSRKRGGQAFWGQHRQRRALGGAFQSQGRDLAGAELRYLPPYSPDMNPIEKAYSKLKAFLRKIAERTVAGLLIALDACADIFKPAQCVNYFKACGYDDTA
jgi:transposase